VSEPLNRFGGLTPLERHLDGETPLKGRNEVGMLSDIREIAERVGQVTKSLAAAVKKRLT
jgi:hypothetical protein